MLAEPECIAMLTLDIVSKGPSINDITQIVQILEPLTSPYHPNYIMYIIWLQIPTLCPFGMILFKNALYWFMDGPNSISIDLWMPPIRQDDDTEMIQSNETQTATPTFKQQKK